MTELPQTSGKRIKTRKLLSKRASERGIRSPSYLLKQYEPGDKVLIKIDPSVHSGMPFRRFYGKVGEVVSKRGRAYLIKVKDGGKKKIVIAEPAHLRQVQ